MKKILFLLFVLAGSVVTGQTKSPVRTKTPPTSPNSSVLQSQAYKDPAQKYLNAVSLPSGSQWNAAFVYWCFNYYTGGNPLPKTGSGIEMWNKLSSRYKLSADVALKDPSQITPGNIYFKTEGDEARVGIVEFVSNGQVNVIEADSEVALTRAIKTNKIIRKTYSLSNIDLGFSNFGTNLAVQSAY